VGERQLNVNGSLQTQELTGSDGMDRFVFAGHMIHGLGWHVFGSPNAAPLADLAVSHAQ
jgi:hypothetical protein